MTSSTEELKKEKLHFPGSLAGDNGGPTLPKKVCTSMTWSIMKVATHEEIGSSWSLVAETFHSFGAVMAEVLMSGS